MALFIGQICFFNLWWIWIQNKVFAQSSTQTTQDDVTTKQAKKRDSTFSFFNKAVYILIYPMMVLAWKLADNSFVYWEIFGFDAVLWHLWNLMKNLANFTLWFLFVYKIFKCLISNEKKDTPKSIIVKALIAWIWIQASWFIMATLIDASTILAYWVWWLPISVLKDSDTDKDSNSKYNPYILKSVIDVDVANLNSTNFYLTNTKVWENKEWNFYISECSTFIYGKSWNDEELIIAPKMTYYKNNSWEYLSTDSNRCHIYGQIYYFSGLYNSWNNDLQKYFGGTSNRTWTQYDYEAALESIETAIMPATTGTIISLIKQWTILEIWDAHTTGWVIWNLWTGVYKSDQQVWLDVDNKRTGSWKTSKLEDILNGNSYVWVFTSLYSNLLNLRTWVITTNNWWNFANVLNSALTLWYVLAIWIPLIIVAVIFMIRIGIIWIAIAFSPFIVLFTAFGLFKSDGIKKIKILEYLSLENLIPIIFSPAIICFAISISAVLVDIIKRFNTTEIATESQKILWWLIEMNIWSGTIPLAKLIIAVFWVAITRFLVWAAIETSKIWESKIIQSLKNLTTTALWNIPIIPIPWKNGQGQAIWINAAFGTNGGQWIIPQLTQKIKEKYEGESREAVQQLIDPSGTRSTAQNNAKANRVSQYISSLSSATINNWDWRDLPMFTPNDALGSDNVNTTFNTLESNSDKEKVINTINNLGDKSKIDAFGNSAPSITIWSDTRTYDTTQSKYKKQTQNNPSTPASNGSNTPTTV